MPPMARRDATGIILAGGQGTRMGAYKPLVPFLGFPLVSRALTLMGQICDDVVVTMGPSNVNRGPLEALSRNALFVNDPGSGPVGAIFAGARLARTTWLYVAPCDTPLITRELYGNLRKLAEGHDAAVPRLGGRAVPVIGTYKRETVMKVASTNLSKGRRSAQELLAELQVAYLEGEALTKMPFGDACVRDVDTQEEVDALASEVRKKSDEERAKREAEARAEAVRKYKEKAGKT
ncbi:MAG: molybdenum cofactor guanylyltransferase [Methanobacteriota archaeon]